MNRPFTTPVTAEAVALKFVLEIASIGSVTHAPRLNGYALFEDDVMFGFVEADGTIYLRTTPLTGARFQSLGSTKHPEMPYWSIPDRAAANRDMLCQLAYEAADNAHLALSFGIDDLEPASDLFLAQGRAFGKVITYALLAA